MEIAKIKVTGVRAEVVSQKPVPAGIVGATIHVEYADPVWSNLRKTVVFNGCTTRDVLSNATVITIPAEVVARPGTNLLVGFYGVGPENTLVVPTLRASLGKIQPAANPSGDSSAKPSLPVWAQLQQELEELRQNSNSCADGCAVAAKIEQIANGATITVSDKNGTTVATITDGSKGADGKDGYTPVKGVDYWTDADKESIVQQVLTVMGMHVVGVVGTDGSITFSGKLPDGVYTIKYEDADGTVTDVGSIDTRPAYTNMLLQAVESDDTPYNGGLGWKTNTRLSSSGGESTSSATGMECTGFIPFKRGDVIRFSGITMNANSTNVSRCYFIQYDSSKTMLKQWVVSVFNTPIKNGWALADADGNITQINTADFADESNSEALMPIYTNAAYFRISADEINADSIITINQEIN